MRQGVFFTGFILIIIGATFMMLSALPRTSEFTERENIFYKLENYGSLDYHIYETKSYLVSGTYELTYCFSSYTYETVEYYVSILDPDSVEVKSDYDQKGSGRVIFETGKTGKYTFQLNGMWITVDVYLYKLTETIRTTYPYGFMFYVSLLLLMGGATLSIFGALIRTNPKKEKQN